MGEENKETTIPKTPATPVTPTPKAGERKYSWSGIQPKNPDIYNLYGNVKLKPWSMTDAEIDKCIELHPDLARLWEKKG
jgi:hypothetical protein